MSTSANHPEDGTRPGADVFRENLLLTLAVTAVLGCGAAVARWLSTSL